MCPRGEGASTGYHGTLFRFDLGLVSIGVNPDSISASSLKTGDVFSVNIFRFRRS